MQFQCNKLHYILKNKKKQSKRLRPLQLQKVLYKINYLSVSAANPGNTLPSRYSKEAPPPVET